MGRKTRVLHPRANAIHVGKRGEGNGVGKEDVGRSYLPVFFWREISAAPRLLGGPEGNWVLSVVEFPFRVGDVL